MATNTINQVQWTSPDQIALDVSTIRAKLQAGKMSVADANAALDAAAKAYATSKSAQGTMVDGTKYTQTLSELKSQAYTGLGNITQPDGQVYSVDPSGNAVKVSTTTHQSTTTGAGTTSYTGNSIVDYLKSVGKPSDYDSRASMAASLGIQNYTGTAAQNAQLLNLAQGTVSNPGGPSTGPVGPTGPGPGGFPKPESTGNPTLDAAQDAQYKYVTGSLAQGYTINPALTGTSLAAMLPQFIQQTAAQLEPELLQDFQTEMVGVNNSLSKLSTIYENSQGQTIQDFQQSLGNLRDQTSMGGGAEASLERGLTNSANRSLSSLDANYKNEVSGVLNQAGAALGPGAFGAILGTAGYAPDSLNGYSAFGVNAPASQSRTVSNQGGDSVFAGSASGGRTLDFNYNPSMYTYGSIPAAFGQKFGTTLDQLFSNYQRGSAVTPSTSAPAPSGITSSYGNSLPSYSGQNGYTNSQGIYVPATF